MTATRNGLGLLLLCIAGLARAQSAGEERKPPPPAPAAKPAPALKAEAAAKPKADAATAPKPAPAPPVAKKPKAAKPPEEAPAEGSSTGRAVRVRLLDGSTVAGLVRAEQAEALVIDCNFGQLSIPRARIATIAYDAAAQLGSKRAPVQQLDDEAPEKAPQP